MSSRKWGISIYCGILFLIFSSNQFYQIISNIFSIEFNGCPSYKLMLINSILFGLFLRLMMRHNAKSIDKWRYSYYTWYMFVFLNNPLTYNLVNNIFGFGTAEGNCPTNLGLYVHTILFTIVLRYSMDLEPTK